jgi:hypothetical protein
MSRYRLLVLVLALVAVAAGVVTVLTRRDTTTVLDIDQVAATATAPSTSGPEPTGEVKDGGATIYVYDTVGYEEVDALAGARHDYPSETYLTVQPGGCGQIIRWQVIEERWTSWEVCDPEHLTVAGVDSFHRWFGVDDLQQYRCAEPAPYLPPSADVEEWTFTCSTGERSEESTATVVGVETLEIGGQEVDTLHLHLASSLAGESSGGSVIDRWISTAERLPVKEVSYTESSSPSLIGTVTYTEQYEITLQSLHP